jgi:superfamily II DNA or RNA helicase
VAQPDSLDVVERPNDSATRPLRGWQRRALTRYLTVKPKDFLAVATPGAGKTTFGLRVAAELLAERAIEAITIVTPTEHLKYQWAVAAREVGIPIDANFRNTHGATSRDYQGVAVTYAQVAAHPALHRVRTEHRKTLVILDEIHHGGDAKSWGDAIREAFTPATRRLALTGTPFRSDDSPIPFVNYEPDPGGFQRSKADHSYGYAQALADGVVRPVIFLAYSGEASWRTSAGEEYTARLGEPLTQEHTARAWRTALDPTGEWIPAVLRAADMRLTQLRSAGMPDAGALVIASDHESAKAYAKLLAEVSGQEPTVVLSDDPKASGRIAEFAATTERWLVAVRMVSEGVDVPRLAVGVYATSASTPLFFAQAVGRFVRARRAGETASVFVPSVPVLLELASQMEAERDHVLGKPHREKDGWDDELLADANRTKDELGGTAEEQDYLGLPGLLEPDQVRALLRQRQDQQLSTRRGRAEPEPAPDAQRGLSVSERLAELRRELNALVAVYHHRTAKPHGKIHGELRRVCGGPPTAMASIEHLEERIATLRSW